jgi:hypothetical protein
MEYPLLSFLNSSTCWLKPVPAETGRVKPVKADAKERKRAEMVHEGAYSNATVTR